MSLEECTTTLSMGRVPLKALLLLLIFSFGSLTVSGTILSFPVSDAQRNTGSFLLTVSPSSISIPQGMNATSTISLVSAQGFKGTVSLSAQVTVGGIAVSFNPGKINIPAGGTATSIATLQAAKNASLVTDNIIVTGIAVTGKKVISSSALLTATVDPQADFGLYAHPDSIIVVAGFSNATSIVLASKNGFYGSVSLFATVPFGFLGVMGGQNPMTLTPGATANTSLEVMTTASTLLGRYNITITGSSGGISHSCILPVNVVNAVPESLALSGSTTNSPTSLTLSLRNNGNTPITLQSYSVSDLSGDAWTLSNWVGPTISPGSSSPAVILISTSCNTCTYNGVLLLFQQFLNGHTYSVTVTTKLNNQFTFTVTA